MSIVQGLSDFKDEMSKISSVARVFQCITGLFQFVKGLFISPSLDFVALQGAVTNRQDLAKLNTDLRERYFREADAAAEASR